MDAGTNSIQISMEPSFDTMLDDRQMESLMAAGITSLAVPVSFYDLGEQRVKQRWATLRRMGFVADTCHPPFGGGNQPNSLCAEDEAVRQKTVETYSHYLRAFEWTGVRAIPVHTGGAMHRAGGKAALARLTDTLEKILPIAKDSGVILALENTFYSNPCPFFDAPNPSGVQEKYINDDCAMLHDYVCAYDDDNIRICHDAGHSILFGNDLMHDLECLYDKTVLYHLHDNDGVEDLHMNIGEGVFPWATLKAFFKTHPPVAAVYDEVLNDADAGLRKVVKRLDRIVAYHRQADGILNG